MRSRRRTGVACVVAVALAAGCAAPTVGLALPPSEADRAAFGSVAVVVATATASASGAAGLPAHGGLEGTEAGIEQGMAVVGPIAEASPFVGGALGMFLLPFFAVAGAISAPSHDEIARADAVIAPILGDAAADDAFAARVVAAADSVAGVRCVAPDAAATVLQVHVGRIAMEPRHARSAGAKDFAVFVTGGARVVRTCDGAVIYDGTFTTCDRPAARTYVAWAADDGRALRAAIGAAIDRVAIALAEEAFLVDRTLVQQPPRYGLRREAVKVDPGGLLFRWEQFRAPPEWTSDPAASPGDVGRVTYEFRLFDVQGAAERSLDGLTTDELRLAGTSRGTHAEQLWTVRPRVETSRGVRLGPWSQYETDDLTGRSPEIPPSVRSLTDSYGRW